MLVSTNTLLRSAQEGGYAIGAFNVYNLEGVRAVVAAAEAERSPAMLQLHPAALKHGGTPLVALCLAAAREAAVPISVHLDHSASLEDIRAAIDAGITSVMADGSELSYADNIAFTREAARLAHQHGGFVEAELGRLTGTEDDLTIPENLAKLTDPGQAADFAAQTGLDALAVCIGNAHGRYRGEPRLDFERLEAIQGRVSAPLVLHGASGLPEAMVRRAMGLGVRKFNVNTEVREAYLGALKERLLSPMPPDLVELMQHATEAMKAVVSAKIRLFGSSNKEIPWE
jgi:tagatose 1,6-diphosphate aldolase GatY/KbaY